MQVHIEASWGISGLRRHQHNVPETVTGRRQATLWGIHERFS